MKNGNGNLRVTEQEGKAQSSYLPELQYLQQFFLVETPGMVDLGQLLFLTTTDCTVCNSFLDV